MRGRCIQRWFQMKKLRFLAMREKLWIREVPRKKCLRQNKERLSWAVFRLLGRWYCLVLIYDFAWLWDQ